MRKKVISGLVLVISVISYVYVGIISSIPNSITIIAGDNNSEYSFNRLSWITEIINTDLIGKNKVQVNLLGKIPIKSVDVNIVEGSLLIASGQSIGVRINTKGLSILTFESFRNVNGDEVMPYRDLDIKKGDVITKVDDSSIENVEDFVTEIQNKNGMPISLTLLRDNKELKVNITPQKDKEDLTYKVGIWVKELTSGVGTVTFIDPVSQKYGALGHGINDSSRNCLLEVRDGIAYNAVILSIAKGQKGEPGELKGAIKEDDVFGTVEKNTDSGIFGKVSNTNYETKEIEIALKDKVEVGEATILCNTEGLGVEDYDVYIEKINNRVADSKNMVIKVTDEELIKKTGGIVQGMSGACIIQNGKIVGAVTHVLLNDPTRGYGVFIENMLQDMN